jgi:predicted nucleic acid binding AN1-type Zn finger protein
MDAYFMMERNMINHQVTTDSQLKELLPNPDNVSSLKSESSIKIKKKKKNKCSMPGCNKKLNIISFTCKCEKKYCSIHRMPESHACTFDYKAHGKCLIAEKNPQIVKSKITQI